MDTKTARPPTRRGPFVTLWLVRAVIVVHLLMVLAQPVLAGRFLTGDVDAIVTHGLIGSLLAVVGLAAIVTTLLYVLGGRGRLWVAPVAVALFLADGIQIGAGYARNLSLHVPLGVAIVVTSVLLAVWAFTPSASRPRGAR